MALAGKAGSRISSFRFLFLIKARSWSSSKSKFDLDDPFPRSCRVLVISGRNRESGRVLEGVARSWMSCLCFATNNYHQRSLVRRRLVTGLPLQTRFMPGCSVDDEVALDEFLWDPVTNYMFCIFRGWSHHRCRCFVTRDEPESDSADCWVLTLDWYTSYESGK